MATIAPEREIFGWLQEFACEDPAKRRHAVTKLRNFANVTADQLKKVTYEHAYEAYNADDPCDENCLSCGCALLLR